MSKRFDREATMADVTGGQRPTEMLATADGVVLSGDPVSVDLAVPDDLAPSVRAAFAEAPETHIYLTIDDLRADHTPGVVYGVYLDLPLDAPEASRESYHIGNIAPFGIEHMTDPAPDHEGRGFRHVFDITDRVRVLQDAGAWDPSSMRVTFEMIQPLPPPGNEEMAAEILEEQQAMAAAEPLHVGSIGLFRG